MHLLTQCLLPDKKDLTRGLAILPKLSLKLRTFCFLFAVTGVQVLLCYGVFACFGYMGNYAKCAGLLVIVMTSLVSVTLVARVILLSAQGKIVRPATIFSRQYLLKDLLYFNSFFSFMGVIGAFLITPALTLLLDVYTPFAVLIPTLTSLMLIFPGAGLCIFGALISNFLLVEPFYSHFYLKLVIAGLSVLLLAYFCLRFSFGLWYGFEHHKNIYRGLKWSWLATRFRVRALLKHVSLLGLCLSGLLIAITTCFELACGKLLYMQHTEATLTILTKIVSIVILGVLSALLLGLLLEAHAFLYNQLKLKN